MASSVRNIVCITLIMSSACVIKLTDRNSPEENGGVTGPPADCSQVKAPPGGAFGGAAEPKFVGRFATEPSEPGAPPNPPFFDWSGTYITIRFQGTDRVTVKLLQLGPVDQMFEFVVDDLEPVARRITVKNDANGNPTNTPQEDYEITGLDRNSAHEIIIHKNTEPQKGSVAFKGFDLHGGQILPPTRRPRRIEFIGDSIMCGYGNEGKNATCPFEVKVRDATLPDGRTIPITVPLTENQYLAFTSVAARALDADAVTTCWSGKGVYLNYKERVKRDPATGKFVPLDVESAATMPQLWETHTIANDFEGYKWDFAAEKPEEKPQVVVISLGTNDFSRDTLDAQGRPDTDDPAALPGDNVPDGNLYNPDELRKFYEKYAEHVKKVRANRPGAHFFLATPPMVTDQYPLDNARKLLRATLDQIVADQQKAGDQKIYAMDLIEQGFRYGLGCDYHPNLEVHRIMAKQLVGAIKSKTCW
jgi:lysophospholipase L1-like esterase